MTALSQHPTEKEFAPYYASYIARVPKGDVVKTLASQVGETLEVLRSLPQERGGHRYAPEKWSIREMIGHLIDAERIFSYRALTIARGHAIPLAGFDENEYVRASGADNRTLADLADELEAVRHSTVALYKSFEPDAVARSGIANNVEVTVRALAYITAGHELHHLDVLRTRYLAP